MNPEQCMLTLIPWPVKKNKEQHKEKLLLEPLSRGGEYKFYLREGVKQLVLSFSQSVSQYIFIIAVRGNDMAI